MTFFHKEVWYPFVRNSGGFSITSYSILRIGDNSSSSIPFYVHSVLCAFRIRFACSLCLVKWKTRGRGLGVRGPGVWKTRGLGENTGSQWKTNQSTVNTGSKWKVAILLFQIAMKINQRETRFFDHESELNIS